MEVMPPGESPPAPEPGSLGSKRLRADLWHSWIDWTPGYRRVYDRERDLAKRIPTVPVRALPDDQRELIEALESKTGRAIEIQGLSIEKQLELMADFAEKAGDEGEGLSRALQTDKPAQAFRAALRGQRRPQEAWTATLVGAIRQEIEAWVQENALDIDIDEHRAAVSGTDSPPPSAPGGETANSELLRTRQLVHQAVEAMTLSELLDLRIAVRHLVGNDN